MTEKTFFNIAEAIRLSEEGTKEQVKKYIDDNIFPLAEGGHMVRYKKWLTMNTSDLREVIFGRLHKDYTNYYFKVKKDLRTVVYEFNKPEIYDDKINLCMPIKHVYVEDWKPSKKIQPKFKVLEDYMKNILCSGNVKCYEFVLKWLANTVRGNKNNSCLYLKGAQGSGKSTLFYFMSNYVIGSHLCLETGSDPIRTRFNEILGGKLLVSIEELENFSRSEWESISSTLKRMITSDRIVLQNKGTKAHDENNMNNYILCSNNDAIKDDDGRRYFILDISTEKIGNHSYYNNLYETIMNDEVGKAFYHFLMHVDLTGFNPQEFPLTQSKIESIVTRLDSVSKFIKDEYILRKLSIDCTCANLYSQYIYSYKGKQISAIAFHRKMSELGFEKKRRTTKWYYLIPIEKLNELAEKKHWITEYDEYYEPLGTGCLETVTNTTEEIEPFEDEEA